MWSVDTPTYYNNTKHATVINNNNNIMVETHSSKKRKCNAGAAGADGVVWIVEQLQAAVSTSSEDIMSVKTSEA